MKKHIMKKWIYRSFLSLANKETSSMETHVAQILFSFSWRNWNSMLRIMQTFMQNLKTLGSLSPPDIDHKTDSHEGKYWPGG